MHRTPRVVRPSTFHTVVLELFNQSIKTSLFIMQERGRAVEPAPNLMEAERSRGMAIGQSGDLGGRGFRGISYWLPRGRPGASYLAKRAAPHRGLQGNACTVEAVVDNWDIRGSRAVASLVTPCYALQIASNVARVEGHFLGWPRPKSVR